MLALDDLKLITGNEVRPVVSSSDDIGGLISRMNRLDDAVAEAVLEEEEDELAAVTDIRESADDAPTIKLVNSVIAQAVEEGASELAGELMLPCENEQLVGLMFGQVPKRSERPPFAIGDPILELQDVTIETYQLTVPNSRTAR